MPTGNEITVSVTNPASLAVAVPGASSTVPTIVNGGTANVSITSVGDRGPKGDTGPAVNLTIGTVTKGANAAASITGTPPNQTLNLTLPQGDTGPTGGYTEIVAGKTTTLSAGSSATVTATPSNGGATVTLDFGIPAGAGGSGGASPALSDATPSKLGTASPGTSSTASRSDHVHALPTAADVGASPTNHGHDYVTKLNSLTGALTLAAGDNVTITPSGSTLTIAATASGVALSDATPQPLGAALAGNDSQASRADHSHAMPTASDVGALDSGSTLDGGFYVGVIVVPGPSITITSQPTNQSATVGGVSEQQATLPSGLWGYTSRANSQWFVSGSDSNQADYIAVSSDGANWTRRVGLPAPGAWSPVVFANGVYATATGNQVAYSSDAITWGTSSISYSRGSVFAAAGKFLRATQSNLYHSTDAQNWTISQAFSDSSGLYFGHDGSTFFAAGYNGTVYASANGEAWSLALTNLAGFLPSLGTTLRPVLFDGWTYLSRYLSTAGPWRYQSGSSSAISGLGTSGGEFATDGNNLVYYRYYGTSGGVQQGQILTSTNGSTWTVRPLPETLPSGKIATLIYTGSRFVLLRHPFQAETGTTYYTSLNGVDWTKSTRTYPTLSFGNAFLSGNTFATQKNGVWNSITFGGTTATATFSVAAFFSSAISYQWQVSVDGGSTWSNITDGTSATLTLFGLTSADSGKRYRVVLSAVGAPTITSNSVTLTVN